MAIKLGAVSGDTVVMLVGGVLVGLAALYALRAVKDSLPKLANAPANAVLGLGDLLGVPRTDVAAGEAAWSRGDYLEASTKLPAADFVGHVIDAATGNKAEAIVHGGTPKQDSPWSQAEPEGQGWY